MMPPPPDPPPPSALLGRSLPECWIGKSNCKLEEADFLKGLRVVTSQRHGNLVRVAGVLPVMAKEGVLPRL
jgi:hypothetical protein